MALAALTIAPAAAGAHSRKQPDPIAHMAIKLERVRQRDTPATHSTKRVMEAPGPCA